MTEEFVTDPAAHANATGEAPGEASMDEPLKETANRSMADRPRPPPPREHRKNIVTTISDLAYRHSSWQVFSDFVEMSAISLSNAVDLRHREEREARYMTIVKRYNHDEVQKFPYMFSELVEEMEAEIDDVLGRVFHDLELHNKYAGQYFTPYHLCRMMALMTLDADAVKEHIAKGGIVTAQEPTCGSGAMMIALAEAMKDADINYQQHLHVTAVDIDAKCVHMAYVQFALLHIPAVIVHGNSLSLEEFDHWHTPAHILDGWGLQRRFRAAAVAAAALLDPAPEAVAEDPEPAPPAEPEQADQDQPRPLKPLQLNLF
jgi:hypothetical protein